MTLPPAVVARRLTGTAELLRRLDMALWAVADGNAGYGLARAATLQAAPAGALAWLSALPAAGLGDAAFRRAHGLRYAYVGGDMAGGISSPELVSRLARAGMLGFYGAGGVEPEFIAAALDDIARRLPHGQSYGANLLHQPTVPQREWETARLYVAKGVPCVSASGYLALTPPIVYCRLKGLRRGHDGRPEPARHVFAKVSRSQVARYFLEPAPPALVRPLVEAGELAPHEAALASAIPMADRITAEGDSAGHTDKQATLPLLSTLNALCRQVSAEHRYLDAPCVGCAGGIATPATVAAAFAAGAAYVLSGSINQACREAATSETVKQMLAAVETGGVQMAPAGDMFEIGARVQVLKLRTLFAPRANQLYELYQRYESLEALPAAERHALEQQVFRRSFEEVWQEVEAYLRARHPEYVERGRREPRYRMGLVFRWYMLMSSRWARDGTPDREVDYQVWCGPAMAAFNAWAAGSFLAALENRTVVQVARNLMEGAAFNLRVRYLLLAGLELPSELHDFRPHSFPDTETER